MRRNFYHCSLTWSATISKAHRRTPMCKDWLWIWAASRTLTYKTWLRKLNFSPRGRTNFLLLHLKTRKGPTFSSSSRSWRRKTCFRRTWTIMGMYHHPCKTTWILSPKCDRSSLFLKCPMLLLHLLLMGTVTWLLTNSSQSTSRISSLSRLQTPRIHNVSNHCPGSLSNSQLKLTCISSSSRRTHSILSSRHLRRLINLHRSRTTCCTGSNSWNSSD